MMKADCIDLERLHAYIEGRVTDEERAKTDSHLMVCGECWEEVIMARVLMNSSGLTEYEPETGSAIRAVFQQIRDKLKQKITDWLTDIAPPEWLLCEASPVRSPSAATAVASILVRKDIDDLQTEMYVEKTEDGNACFWIKVFKDDETAKNVSLTLLKDGEIPFARIQKKDYALFEKQPFGSYSLTIEHKDRKQEEWTQTAPYHFEICEAGFYEKRHDLS